jgi:hypothetical protein
VRLNSSRAKIYREIWVMPYSKKLRFLDVSNLLVALGCDRHSKGGANVVFEYNGKAWGMHPPHPKPYIKRPYIKDLRNFLIESGIKDSIEGDQ